MDFIGPCDGCAPREIAALMLQDFSGHLKPLLMRLDPTARVAQTYLVLPFLENDLVRFAMNLPLEVKLRWHWKRMKPVTKWLLLDALAA